jgi:hypothetical protein
VGLLSGDMSRVIPMGIGVLWLSTLSGTDIILSRYALFAALVRECVAPPCSLR